MEKWALAGNTTPSGKERYLPALISVRGEFKDLLKLGIGSLLQNHEKLPVLLRQAEMNTQRYIQA